MSLHPLFSLGGRLQLCASMVRPGVRLADIGTDHAYLPIWLAKKGLIAHAVAADVRVGPLQKAQANIDRYRVPDVVTARLSNGLDEILPEEADDITIAGMGGETIIDIVSRASWLKDKAKHLILQPMTSAEQLRIYLAEQGFSVLQEQAVQDEGRIYSAFMAVFMPELVCADELYPHIGRLDASTEDNRLYIIHKISNLQKRADGLAITGRAEEAAVIRRIINQLNTMLEKRE